MLRGALKLSPLPQVLLRYLPNAGHQRSGHECLPCRAVPPAPQPVQQHVGAARDLLLHHQIQRRDPVGVAEGRAVAPPAATRQAGAGHRHHGAGQLRTGPPRPSARGEPADRRAFPPQTFDFFDPPTFEVCPPSPSEETAGTRAPEQQQRRHTGGTAEFGTEAAPRRAGPAFYSSFVL
ncbi:hypothetical protein EYF80_030437 [Liparis tanakae]|uniref:Uncharacterized protein n=1 Tax=Liparis tanakae TaxID=230148 RepID=A0A4Z2H3E4_9TELE|nr:hypothetical protein EYF80_030437 [Liparis tanakae]